MSKVEMICPGGKIDKKALLAALLADPELKAVTTVCLWKDKTITTGWSSGMSNGELALGLLALQDAIVAECRGTE